VIAQTGGKPLPDCTKKPEVLYHFTSPMWFAEILRTGRILLTENNLNNRKENGGVVWLTSSPDAANQGLKFNAGIPAELDKTSIRITLPYKEFFLHWDEWSDGKGIDKGFKSALILSAHAEETHKTWYISEQEISVSDFIKADNMVTGDTTSIGEAIKTLPSPNPLKFRFSNPTDEYIMKQPAHTQIILLEVRSAIRNALPEATEKISWSMPTFWQGRNLIHFAAQKNHLGIYPGAEAIEHFEARLSEYRHSKGAIQFPYKSFGTAQREFISEIAVWCGMNAAGAVEKE
jgi:uncharacterized protein YdhG (YjbR/CyaY superfamily)